MQMLRGQKGSGWSYHSFAYGDAAATVVTVPAGKRVLRCEITITTAFNGAGAAIDVGDASDVDSVMAGSQSLPSTQATFSVTPQAVWGSATEVKLTITPGSGASAGAGVLALQVEQ